jgi:hypothetical protein
MHWYSVASILLSCTDARHYNTSGGPLPGVLNVHLIPHTHDDGGWLKTVDEYYTGQNNSIQHANVQFVLDSVVEFLSQNPDRTFVEVEQAFFQRWWRQQDEDTRTRVKRLVAAEQLEMINGAWVMHDEAAAHYIDMIDQTTLGHKFLMDEFQVLPKIGWQIDPFGHSATQAALLSAEVGFQGLFFGRIDYQDRELRINQSACEFIWRASEALGVNSQVFTGLTGEYGGNYGPPEGFNWDVLQNDEPIQDDENLEDYNVQSRLDDFVRQAMWQADHTRGNHIMMTMGSDFQYESARNWYVNMDKLIHYAKQDGRINVFYSTPSRYVAEKKKESLSWPLKTDDFFPYADGPHQFWTGYFTSRPNLKRAVRAGSAFFQIAKQAIAFGTPTKGFTAVEKLAEAMGLLQHHDAVSGTAKQHATSDYSKRLHAGRKAAEPHIFDALASMSGLPKSSFSFCTQRNVSRCDATSKPGEITMIVWNALAQNRTEILEIPTASSQAVVTDILGASVPVQVVRSLPSFTDAAMPSPHGLPYTILVEVDLPPIGYKVFRVQLNRESEQQVSAPVEKADDIFLKNEFLEVKFCSESGRICHITDLASGTKVDVVQDWLWYTSSEGNNAESSQASGAYIFRPNKTHAETVLNGTPTLSVTRGELADEVVQTFGDIVTQRVRLPRSAHHLEVTYTVTNLPIDDGLGKELVFRLSSDIKNNHTCFTDSNGREMLKRKKNFRPTWALNQTEPVAGTYFPINTALFIKDESAQLTVLTDAAQGGTGCITEGVVELMAHRRCLHDDGRGVGEPLNETEFVHPYAGDGGHHGEHYGGQVAVRGKYYISVSRPETAAAQWRPLQDQLYLPAAPFFSTAPASEGIAASYSALAQALPMNLQLISVQPDVGSMLVRLAHQFGLDEDAELSKPVAVDLASIFGVPPANIQELTLTGTMPVSELDRRRIDWKTDTDDQRIVYNTSKSQRTIFTALQVRTFKVLSSNVLLV